MTGATMQKSAVSPSSAFRAVNNVGGRMFRVTQRLKATQSTAARPDRQNSKLSITCSSSLTAEDSSRAPPAAVTYPTHSWKWRGHTIKYISAGCGKPVLLVHGFGASWGHYKRNIPEIAKTNKVYAIDLLGFGASDKPIMEYTMEVWRDLLQDFIAEFMGGQQVVIVGNSLGSLASLMVCASMPEQIAGCVLFNCAGGMNNKAISDDWRIKLVMPIFLLIDFLLSQPSVARYLFDKFRTRNNLRSILTGVYPANPANVDDDLVELLYGPSCDQGALEAFVSIVTGPPGPRPEELIPQFTAPMLVVWGDKDNFTPSDGPVGKYFQALPQKRALTEFVHLPGLGHCLMDEQPGLVHDAVLPWLNKVH